MNVSSLYWPITFFSTAFGAGIFFLPQSVGPRVIGIKYFVIFMTVAMIISLFTHFLFYKFIISHKSKDYLLIASEFLGKKCASLICSLFVLSMIIIVMINFITMINAVCSLIGNYRYLRFCVSLLLSFLLSILLVRSNAQVEKLISKVAVFSIASVACITVTFLCSDIEYQFIDFDAKPSLESIMLLPVFLFTFNFTPCLQRFSNSNPEYSIQKLMAGKLIILACIAIVVFSISKVISTADIGQINDANIDALSYASGAVGSQFIGVGSVVSLVLLTMGAYIGTLIGVIDGINSFGIKNNYYILLCNVLVCTVMGTVNPSVVKIIANYSMPVMVTTIMFIPALFFIIKGGSYMRSAGLFVMLCGVVVMTTIFV